MNMRKVFGYLCLVLSIISITLGVYLVINSFKHETLDGKYIIERSTDYNSEKKELSEGEISVIKDVKYISKGRYKIVFKINYNTGSENKLLSNKSKFTITEIIGDSFKLDTDKIIINKDPIKLYSYNTITSDYEMNYNNNTFEISFPNNKIFKYNTVTLFINLIGRDINTKYVTSKESYYSLIPNRNNDFYSKKTMQSYIIDGNGYIVLQNK